MAWVVLVLSGCLEAAWAISLKASDGFTKPIPVIIFLVTAAASFAGLSWAMKTLPTGPAYAVWVGVGAALTAVIGMIALQETVSVIKILSLLAIVAGVVGLAVSGGGGH